MFYFAAEYFSRRCGQNLPECRLSFIMFRSFVSVSLSEQETNFLNADQQHVASYWQADTSITVRTSLRVFGPDYDHTSSARWRDAATSASPAAILFSCVNFCHLCFSDESDRYSIRGYFSLQLLGVWWISCCREGDSESAAAAQPEPLRRHFSQVSTATLLGTYLPVHSTNQPITSQQVKSFRRGEDISLKFKLKLKNKDYFRKFFRVWLSTGISTNNRLTWTERVRLGTRWWLQLDNILTHKKQKDKKCFFIS